MPRRAWGIVSATAFTTVLTSITALGINLLTLAPDLTWKHFGADGGELIAAAVTLGIPHPPGYPIYVLVGKLASYIPLGTIAYRFNLLSAISASVATGFVAATAHAQIAQNQTDNARVISLCSAAAGLTLALAPLVWSQATIAEVYALNLAFLAAFLWALLSKRPAWLVGLLLGISSSTHLTSWLMLPLALCLTPYRQWPKLGLGLAVGLSPFLLMPWMAQTGSPVIWGNPSTFSGWWWLVTGRIYHANALAFGAIDLPRRLGEWSLSFLQQFTLAGPFLLGLGLIRLRRESRRQAVALLLTAMLFFVYAIGYDSADAIVYVLPGLLILAILLTPGIKQVGRLSMLLPLVLLLSNFDKVDSSADNSLRPAAERIFAEAPANALLITPGDATIFALWYYHHVEAQRSDLMIVDRNLYAFDWYRQRVGRMHPDLAGLAEDDLAAFQALNGSIRPVCTVQLSPIEGEVTASVSCDEENM